MTGGSDSSGTAPAPGSGPVGCGDYEVQPGEGLSYIAWKHGFFWATLWDLPENAELKEVRANPEVLLPGDKVTIPKPRQKTVSCATGRRHVFRRKGVPSKIAFQVRTGDGTVFADCRYRLTMGEQVYEGRTDPDGRLEQWVPPSLQEAELTVWLNRFGFPETAVWTLKVGRLEPVTTLAGVQSRLANLGYDVAGEAGDLGPRTSAALRSLQLLAGLESTGLLDDATRQALLDLHGS